MIQNIYQEQYKSAHYHGYWISIPLYIYLTQVLDVLIPKPLLGEDVLLLQV